MTPVRRFGDSNSSVGVSAIAHSNCRPETDLVRENQFEERLEESRSVVSGNMSYLLSGLVLMLAILPALNVITDNTSQSTEFKLL